jgi:hypothetical protein
MIINSFQINDALQLTPIAHEKVADACQSKEARIWVVMKKKILISPKRHHSKTPNAT